MKAVTAEQMREIDRAAIEEYGIPGVVLMGFAGRAVFEQIQEQYPAITRAAVFAGGGNNGGDGFIAAYLLSNAGVETTVYFSGSREKMSESSATYYELCVNAEIRIIETGTGQVSSVVLTGTDLIIDAILGTGFEGKPRSPVAELIDIINSSGIPVVSIDVPSGLPSDGKGPESSASAVRADLTVTMGLPKLSLVTFPGRDYAGRVIVADIGFPSHLSEPAGDDAEVMDEEFYHRHYTALASAATGEDINKTDRGHLLLVGGFDGMEGAIMMTAMGALETGTGLVTLITTEQARAVIAGKIPELITRGISEQYPEDDLREILEARRYDALVIGPGMGRDPLSEKIFRMILEHPGKGVKSILIDGDGLYHFAQMKDIKVSPGTAAGVITPHMMEASRISGHSLEKIQNDRLQEAHSLAESTGMVAVLKGPGTIVAREKKVLINSTGNRTLATGGTGDILSGIIGSLLLSGMDPLYAAGIGVYIHGAAADLFVRRNGRIAMKATDILPLIREILRPC